MKCPKCKFYNICKGRLNETVENCVRFKSVVQTNEEWFCNISTKEKAKFLASNKMLNFDYQMWIEWLREKHNA